MAKKRGYDVNTLITGYEKNLESQERKEAVVADDVEEQQTKKFLQFMNDEYVDPDKSDYKRISLFMEWDVWERIQALCWDENEPVNKLIVDKLREWTLNVPQDILDRYRQAMKQKHLSEWEQQRDVLQYWWQTSEIRANMQVQTYNLNRSSLTVTETNGIVHNYYIHRGWITDGNAKYERAKKILAQLKYTK